MEPNFEFDLSDDLKEEIGRYLIRMVEDSINSSTGKDDRFRACKEALEGEPYSTDPNQLYDRGSNIVDPLTLEQHIQFVASSQEARRNPPYVLVEAVNPTDSDAAAKLESAAPVKAHQWGYLPKFYDIDYDAASAPFAIACVTWETEKKPVIKKLYENLKTGEIIQKSDIEAGQQYKERYVRQEDEVVYSGNRIRVPDGADFYTCPANIDDIDRALLLIERQRLTIEELLTGSDIGLYDQETVADMIAQGPGAINEAKADEDEKSGQVGGTSDYDLYEVIQVVGKMPYVVVENKDGDLEMITPDHLLHLDFVWMISLHHQKVFQWSILEDGEHPYVMFGMMRRPRQQQSHCIPTMLSPIQVEMTANAQFSINSMNLATSPVLRVKKSLLDEGGSWELFPGALLGVDDSPDEVTALEMNPSAASAGLEYQQYWNGRGANLVGSEAVHLQPKVRKASEIEAALSPRTDKFSLFTHNIDEGYEKLWSKSFRLWMKHMGDEGEAIRTTQGDVKLTSDDLRKTFRLTPQSNIGSDPEQLRMERFQAFREVMVNSPLYQMALNSGQWDVEKAFLSKFAELTEERNPDKFMPKTPAEMQAEAAMQAAETGTPMPPGPPMSMMGGMAGAPMGGPAGAPGTPGMGPGAPQGASTGPGQSQWQPPGINQPQGAKNGSK